MSSPMEEGRVDSTSVASSSCAATPFTPPPPPLAASDLAPPTPPQALELTQRCRICFGSDAVDESLGKLFSPCKCRGSIKFVHEGCLASWRREYRTTLHFAQCMSCKTRYRTVSATGTTLSASSSASSASSTPTSLTSKKPSEYPSSCGTTPKTVYWSLGKMCLSVSALVVCSIAVSLIVGLLLTRWRSHGVFDDPTAGMDILNCPSYSPYSLIDTFYVQPRRHSVKLIGSIASNYVPSPISILQTYTVSTLLPHFTTGVLILSLIGGLPFAVFPGTILGIQFRMDLCAPQSTVRLLYVTALIGLFYTSSVFLGWSEGMIRRLHGGEKGDDDFGYGIWKGKGVVRAKDSQFLVGGRRVVDFVEEQEGL
ncbi:hypothetical protein HDU97_008269 [Phlyctochytrium planicorne]|nr:hypothetical protein HDU97_008269 [Phlyctochytrium planicorne]